MPSTPAPLSPSQLPAQTVLGKWRSLRQELGTANALFSLAHRLLWRLSGERCRIERFVLVAQPVTDRQRVHAQRLKDVQLRWIGAGDPALAAMPRPMNVLRQRLDQGAHCLVAELHGQLIGFLWQSDLDFDEDVVRVRYQLPDLPAGQRASWDFDIYVAPEHRLGFVLGKLWDAADARMRAQGIAWSMSRISAFNQASLRSHQRLGARTLGPVSFVVLGPLQLMWMQQAPYLDVSLPGRRPVLRVPRPV